MGAGIDKVYIANLALSEIGGKRISSLDEDSPSAIAISGVYELARDEVLEQHMWTFAQKRHVLTTLATTPVMTEDNVSLVYSMPSDLIKINKTSDPQAVFYSEENGIVCNQSGLKIMYTYRNDNPATYSPGFVNALALNLAHKLCFKISESAAYADALLKKYEFALSNAIALDSQNGTAPEAFMDEWSNALMDGSQMWPPQTPGRQTYIGWW